MAENQSGTPAEFKILKQLGEGGYGSVYLIQHPTWGRIAFQEIPDLTIIAQGFGTNEERSGHPKELAPPEYSENVQCTV